MDINDRLRAAFEEFAEAPADNKPSPHFLARKWRVQYLHLQGALCIQQLLVLTEREAVEPQLGMEPPARGRPKLEGEVNERALMQAAIAKAGGVAGAALVLGCSERTIRRAARRSGMSRTVFHAIDSYLKSSQD